MKKSTILTLLFTFILAFLSACGISMDDDVNPYEPSNHGGTVHAPRNFNGRTIVVVSYFENALPFTTLGLEGEPDPATTSNYHRDRLIWDNAHRVHQRYNVNLYSISVDIADLLPTLRTSIMAGAALGDIAFLNGEQILSAALGGLVMPISSVNLSNSDFMRNQHYGRIVNNGFGEHWSFMYNHININNVMMGVNLDIIRATNAPNPVDLYDQWLWRWDDALEIMRLATRDTTGDGVFDQWGIAGHPSDLINTFIAANDGMLIDDSLNVALDNPNTKEALEFMETIFREGLWQYDAVLGVDVGDWERNFFAFKEGNAALFISTQWGINDGNLPFEFAIVPFPAEPSNTSGNTHAGGWVNSFTLPFASSWAPDDLLYVVEEFWSWSGDTPDLMLDDSFWRLRSIYPTEDDVQRHLAATSRVSTDIGNTVPQFNEVLYDFAHQFIHGEMTVAELVDTFRNPQEQLLNRFLGRNSWRELRC